MLFNRICAWIALYWLAASIPLGIAYRPTVPDFEQFYLGGVIARQGDWKSLYPVPREGAVDNPGLSLHSAAKPGWLRLGRELHVRDYTHFMLPPPTALLFVPLSYLTYTQAFWVWTAFLTLCIWGLGAISAAVLRVLVGAPSRAEGLLILMVALAPASARAIRIANVSPPVALCVGAAVLALIQPRRVAWTGIGAGSLVAGALLKYATLILAPLLVALRRWRWLFLMGVLGGAVLLVTVQITGREIFEEFFTRILPTLSRPSRYLGNQSMSGFLARLFGRPLPAIASIFLSGARLVSLALILGFLFRIPRVVRAEPRIIVLVSAALVSWLLLFSPIAWEHWQIFLCPMWGWLYLEGRRSRGRLFAAAVAWLLMIFPAGLFHIRGFARWQITLPEPLNSSQMLGVLLFFMLAMVRLQAESRRTERATLLGAA